MKILKFFKNIFCFKKKSKTPSLSKELPIYSNSEIKADEKQELIKSFGLLNEKTDNGLHFELIPSKSAVINEKWQKIELNKNQKNNISGFLSELANSGSNIGIASQATNGLYRASTNPELLMKLKAGGLGSAVMNGNKISGSAGFLEAGSTFFTPLIIFQVISVAVGKTYMKNISSQLNSIQEKLNEIIRMYHLEREVTMELAFETLNSLSNKNDFRADDYTSIFNTLNELKKIRLEYKKMSEEASKELPLISANWKINSKNSARKTINSFDKSGFIYKTEKCLIANDLYRLGKLIDFNMKKSNESLILDDLIELKNINDNTFYKSVENLYTDVKLKHLENLKNHKKKTKFNNNDLLTIISKQDNDFKSFERERELSFNTINENYNTVLNSFKKEQEIILDCRNEFPSIYLN